MPCQASAYTPVPIISPCLNTLLFLLIRCPWYRGALTDRFLKDPISGFALKYMS